MFNKNEVIIKPLEWNDAELTAEVTRLASELLALDVSRTVLFNPYIPFRYKVDNSINNSPFPQKYLTLMHSLKGALKSFVI